MTRYLVTGAAGFIGFHTSRSLLERGDEVVGVDNFNEYYNPSLKEDRAAQLEPYERFRMVRMDVADTMAIERLFSEAGPEVVIHLAAQAGVRYSVDHPMAYVQSNLVGFANILEGCRHGKVKHLAYASSSSVYGGNTKLPFSIHDNVDHPFSLYAATKKSNELMAHTYSHLYGVPTTGLRFFTVYGPWGRPDMALFLFTRAMLAGEPIQVFNHGKMQRDFTYIDDIVDGVVRVADSPAIPDPSWEADAPDPGTSSAPYRVYNIGNSAPVDLMDFIRAIEKALGVEAKIEFQPMQPGDVPATFADVSDLEKDFKYRPSTPVEEGIERFVQWYVRYFKVELA